MAAFAVLAVGCSGDDMQCVGCDDGTTSSGTGADNSSPSGNPNGGSSSSSGNEIGSSSPSGGVINDYYRYYDPYAATAMRCQGGFVESKCGNMWYSSQTHICISNQIMTTIEYLISLGYERCGSSWYSPANTYQQCLSGNVVLTKCGDDWYDSQTQICVSNQVMTTTEYYISLGYERCGSSWYNPTSTTQRCQGEVIENKCGDEWYNSATQVCHSETIDGAVSQTVIYKERCSASNFVIENRCFVSEHIFNPETQRCGSGGVVETKCGANYYYIPEEQIHFCSGDIVYSKCDGNIYTPSIQYCKNGNVENYDASLTFNDFRDGKTYKATIIGTGETAQIWMAENLNYDVPGNNTDVCYNNDPANCATFGRLYDWATAMTVCPTGWHLPNVSEWDALATAVGGSSNAGTKLKAAGGWGQSNGTDDYGFSALPGGYKSGSSFYNVGSRGNWWSATEYDTNQARYRYINSTSITSDYYSKTNYSYSVRCVKDN
jgi:uncharacterized protein (TIGR02145 family)